MIVTVIESKDAAHVHARETHLVPGLRRRDVVNGPDVVLEGATLDPRRAGRAVEVAQNIVESNEAPSGPIHTPLP